MSVLAAACYSFNILSMGVILLPLLANLLVMGWSIGLMTTALILRFGHQAEALAWAIPFLIQPLCAVFYPVSVLPAWLQPLAWTMPATHIFEAMRQVLAGQALDANYLIYATALNVLYMIIAGWFFNFMFDQARKHGLLAKLAT